MHERTSFRRLEDLERDWDTDPELVAAFRREVPYAEVARAIVGLRVRLGLSQTAFAEKVGRPQSYVARLESGKSNVEVGTLLAFAKVFNMRLELNLDAAPPEEEAAPVLAETGSNRPRR